MIPLPKFNSLPHWEVKAILGRQKNNKAALWEEIFCLKKYGEKSSSVYHVEKGHHIHHLKHYDASFTASHTTLPRGQQSALAQHATKDKPHAIVSSKKYHDAVGKKQFGWITKKNIKRWLKKNHQKTFKKTVKEVFESS